MKKQISLFITICTIVLASCGSGSTVQVAATETASLMPPTATFAPTLTLTPEPTFTPTITPTLKLPVALGTQFTQAGAALSADNINQIAELARWGKGVITDTAYSPDGKLFAVATTLGVSLYQAGALDETSSFETGASVNGIA